MFFIPCAALFTLSILNMQRRGQVKRHEWLVWIPVWIIAMGVICMASWANRQSLFCDSTCLLRAEIIAGIIYSLMQIYYSQLNMRELARMEKVLDNYYDRERRSFVRWIRITIISLTTLALFVPVLMFNNGWPLIAYCLFFFIAIFFMWCFFARYIITNALTTMEEAEESEDAEEREQHEIAKNQSNTLSNEAIQHIGKIIQRWIDEGKHLQSGITKPMVAAELQIPIYQLSSWVKASGYDRYTQWITALRIKEAKRLLIENKDWSNEAIADHCGISRTHFQRLFKQETGFSPAEFVEQVKK
jgi:AraC-like DNA-binding protein